MKIKEKRMALKNRIHESTQLLEFLSDLELLTMNDYEELIEEAEKTLANASENEINLWYTDWIA